MGLWEIFLGLFTIINLIVSGGGGSSDTVVEDSSGEMGISIGGTLVCGILSLFDPSLGGLCETVTGFVIEIADGTIEVHHVNGEWVTLTSKPMQFELLQHPDSQQLMVLKDIQPGKYDKIRIDLENVKILTHDKTYITTVPNKELIIDANIIVQRFRM